MKLLERVCRIGAMTLCAALAAAFSGCAENGVPAAPTAQIEEPAKGLELPAANSNDISEVSLQQNAAPTVVNLPDETAPAEAIRENERQLLGYTGQSGRVSAGEFALGVTYFKTMPDFAATI